MPRIDQIDRRTDVVLILFHHAGSIRGVTKLQKLLFLIEEETKFFEEYESDLALEFEPHKMGPFSKHVYEELRFLKQLGAIDSAPMEDDLVAGDDVDLSNQVFTITTKGKKIAAELVNQLEPKYNDELQDLVVEYNKMTLRRLLQYVYTKYPSFTTESEIKDEILQGAT